MTGALEVLDPGLLTLVEDLGRPGWAHIGVGRSGAADAGALRLANRLVANDEGAAGLEVLLGGLRLRAVGDVTVALAGARGPTWLDDRPVGHEAVLELRSGTELRLGTVTSGLRTYVAVRGGIDVPPVLGSRSTDQLAGLGPAPAAGRGRPGGRARTGGLAGRGPRAGASRRRTGSSCRWCRGRTRTGSTDVLARLQAGEWHVTPATNRVAVRLTGPALARTAEHRAASCRRRAWSSAPCRCRRTGSRSCSASTTPSRAATRWSRWSAGTRTAGSPRSGRGTGCRSCTASRVCLNAREGGDPMDVRVTSRDVGPRTVVEVDGEIDVSSADALRDQLAELLERDRTDLVIDLRAVRFMDSTGLGVLVGTLKKVRLAGGQLQLVIDSERLLKVFRITALLQVFTVHDTVEAALDA